MRIDLQQLSSTAARITLPSVGSDAQFIHIAETLALKGTLEQGPHGLSISQCAADALRLVEAQLRFGTVQLSVSAGALAKRLSADLQLQADETTAALETGHLELSAFTLRAGSVTLTAQIMAREVALTLRHGVGTISTSYLELRDVTLLIGSNTITAPHLVAHDVTLSWGGENGLSLRAGQARAGDLALVLGATRLHATTLACTEIAYKSGRFTMATAQADALTAQAHFERPREGAPATRETPHERGTGIAEWLDIALLDGLRGHIHVDLGVHMLLAVLPRHAVHRLRLDVLDGAIDFHALEDGLARLEDALLDFSVRDQTLVLELGIPFFHTRGHGKPLLRWALSPEDVALAESERVRLSVLAQPLPPEHSDGEPNEDAQKRAPSAFRVRGVDADALDIALALTPPGDTQHGVLRRLGFESIKLTGEAHVRPEGGDEAGDVELDVRALSTSLRALPLGASALSVGELNVPGLLTLEVVLGGARPEALTLNAGATSLRDLSLG